MSSGHDSERSISQRTQHFYDTHAKPWVADHSSRPSLYESEVIDFTNTLRKKNLPLIVGELGVGGGREIPLFRKHGLEKYFAIDFATAMITIARHKNSSSGLAVQDLLHLGFKDNYFGGIWAVAVLHHIPYDRFTDALCEIRRVLVPDGIAYITLREGKGQKINPKTGLVYFRHTQPEIKQTLFENGFNVDSLHSTRLESVNYLAIKMSKSHD